MDKHIIVSGNPADGFDFFGPFTDASEANEWADGAPVLQGEAWWCVKLRLP